MNECADKTLKHKMRPIKNKRHSKSWYNGTCETLKRQFELSYTITAYYGVSMNFINILHNMYNKFYLSVRLPNGIAQSFSSNIGLKKTVLWAQFFLTSSLMI